MLELLSSPFARTFQSFIDSLDSQCLICSPYITMGPVRQMVEAIEKKRLQDSISVRVVTDVSAGNVLSSATDVSALLLVLEKVRSAEIVYLPRIHAKVYVSGTSLAILGSANFTTGGFYANLEYGVSLDDPALVAAILQDITQYARLGGTVTQPQLVALKDRTDELRSAVMEEQNSIRRKARSLTDQLRRATEDDLLRLRVQERPIHAIFAETILYLLARQPMTTVELHGHIRQIHPDLCDDAMDRVIDGERFGRLWKHQVRTAQQGLKRRSMVAYDPVRRVWTLLA